MLVEWIRCINECITEVASVHRKQGFKSKVHVEGQLYRIRQDGVVDAMATNFQRPNGLAFSEDEKRLYLTDTGFLKGYVKSRPSLDIPMLKMTSFVRDFSLCRLMYAVQTDMKEEMSSTDKVGALSAVKSMTMKRGTTFMYILFVGTERSAAGVCLLLWAFTTDQILGWAFLMASRLTQKDTSTLVHPMVSKVGPSSTSAYQATFTCSLVRYSLQARLSVEAF
jgi:hypothetical protein